jgi:formylglycine-generating enzyme required for sulfatase activity
VPLRVFVSYAHEDEAHRTALEKHLTLLRRQSLVEPWHDRMIPPGGKWDGVIDEHLTAADVILLLVSVDFLASDYCWDVEVKRALDRDGAGTARVIPIILDHCDWASAPFAALQALPQDGRPVTDWPNPAQVWTSIAAAIRALAERPAASPAGEPARLDDPARYLAWLRDQHAYLEIRGMGAQVAERMELARVYTQLTASTSEPDVRGGRGARPDAKERVPRRALRSLLGEHPHAALVGDPGSGKTTVLRFVAQNLARALLGEPGALARIGLTDPAPFPVFARLSDVARWLAEHPDPALPDDAPEHFYRFLGHALAGHPLGLREDYLRRRVERGGCFLLLDGLDEVPGEATRRRVARLVEQVVIHGRRVGNRHLVTCRTRAFQGRVQLAADVSTLRLAPFERAQVQTFVESWSRALYHVDAGAAADDARAVEAARYRDELLQAIDANPSGATFTQSPLMLTVLAVVHWNRRRLPEQRAELYDAAVEYLLESRREHSPHPTPLRRECLRAVAMRMFEDDDGVQRTLGRREAAAAVRELLGGTLDEAEAFLEDEELNSGLLVSRTEGEVEFWHLTFQEYLAALELSPLGDDAWRRLEPHLHDDRWGEVVLLLAGCERRGGVREARRMIVRVLDTGSDEISAARAVGLVGRILRDIAPYGGDAAQGTRYREMLRESMAIFDPGGAVVTETLRRDVGEALGQAGDPRLTDPEANRVLVPAGSFWMGAQDEHERRRGYDADAYLDEEPVHAVAVSALRIGRFPVTVAEYRRFVDAGARGYLDARHWDAEGWAWREAQAAHAPGDWEAQLAHPNRPVVMVSWYEASAYCRFVGGRLPTEAEWEWVARGARGRKYPWGSEAPTPDHANFGRRLGEPTPVGIYPLDVHEHGVRDLAGNVDEWCADWHLYYTTREATRDPVGPAEGQARVLRGGSYREMAAEVRAAHRSRAYPHARIDRVGFRVAWRPAAQR